MKYDKLVRDTIPQILEHKGKVVLVHTASEAEYWQKLKQKLCEEAAEFVADETDAELADTLEVLYAICAYRGKTIQDIEQLREQKLVERGGFDHRIILDEIKD